MEKIKTKLYNEITKLIYLIKKCHSNSRYQSLLFELESLYYVCKELEFDDYPRLEDYSNKSFRLNDEKIEQKFINKIFNDSEYHKIISLNYQNIDENKYLDLSKYYTKETVIFDKTLELIESFLESYDKKILNYFYELLDNEKILITNGLMGDDEYLSTPAYTINSLGTFKPYILITRFDDISDSIHIIHELGHAYDINLYRQISNKEFVKKRQNCLDEVFSYYLQFVYMDYLKRQKLYLTDLEKEYMNYNYVCLESLKNLKNSLENNDYRNIDEYLSYSYGILLSYHFLERYNIDSEKTKKDLMNFLTDISKLDMLEILEKYNLKKEIINSKILKKKL